MKTGNFKPPKPKDIQNAPRFSDEKIKEIRDNFIVHSAQGFKQPETKDIKIVYFSTKSENTHRFILKLQKELSEAEYFRIPIKGDLEVHNPYVLFCPSYAGGLGDTKGAVPPQVKRFLNKKENRDLCRAVIPSGNTNFGDTYCISGTEISAKLGVPILWQFELLGTSEDVHEVTKRIRMFYDE